MTSGSDRSTGYADPIAAAGWAFLYWICGGGFFGALILFVVLKMLGD